jgi:penicillin-binding protein 2
MYLKDDRYENIVHHDPEDPFVKNRFNYSVVIIIIAFALLLLRLWYIQVWRGGIFKEEALQNSVRKIEIDAPRGRIFDKFGKIVADVRPSFDVTIVREDIKNLDELLEKLGKILDVDPAEFKKQLNEAKKRGVKKFQPVTVLRDIPWEKMAVLKEHSFVLPGVNIVWKPTRNYIFNDLAAHLIGYISKPNEEELKLLRSYKEADYSLDDYIGKSGIEETMEMVLKGQKGEQAVEVDAFGRELTLIGQRMPYPGADIELTIDLDLQFEAREALRNQVGAIIAIDPQNGEVLAYQSSPAFDPNIFSTPNPSFHWENLLSDESKPLENRPIRGLYPPGSTFKVVLAIAALEEGISPETSFFCNGGYRFGNRTYACWKKEGHGRMNLYTAIVNSCDVYFYQLGLMLGVEKIADYAKKLGFMQASGINISGEKTGLIPDESWKLRVLKEPWFPGETLSLSIGQGYIMVTPMQILNAYQAIANNGTIYAPQIIKRVVTADGEVLREFTPQVLKRVEFKDSTFSFVRNALRGVVMEPGGTGRAAFVQGYEVGGKTGTSQVATSVKGKPEDLPYQLRDHALFVGFSPVDKPRILVVAVIEHGGGGGKVAAPVVGRIIKKFWELENERKIRREILLNP